MAWIDRNLETYLKESFPTRFVEGRYISGTWQTSRYIRISTILKDDLDIHYEYYQEHVELHLEGKYQSEEYREFAKALRIQTSRLQNFKWLNWQGYSQCRCQYLKVIGDYGDLKESFEYIISIFDQLIDNVYREKGTQLIITSYDGKTLFDEIGLEKDEVSLENACLGKIFGNKLIIPNYQRSYCWGEKQLNALWDSLNEVHRDVEYHLGTIILQKTNSSEYAIIDGQQRLVTLTLILNALGYEGDLPLLSQSFYSTKSKNNIAYNKWHIKQLCRNVHDEYFCQKIIKCLFFSVLILKENRLDLAYTFFSNQNAKGVPLSDFDLLKAHHLRFVFDERQSEHMANRWNNMIEKKYNALDSTLSTHIYRLRMWMRKREYDSNSPHRVKDEYSAAPLIPNIPAFGEKFHYYEKIQGGSHFFAYAEKFVDKYELFCNTPEVLSLKNHLQWESHWKYEDVIETLLFGYYLKFDSQYLTEALFCITAYMAQHRFTSRAISYKIREYAKDSEIVMMIDQASSPTFFLAECSSKIHIFGRELDKIGIELRFYQCMQNMFDELRELRQTTLFDFA